MGNHNSTSLMQNPQGVNNALLEGLSGYGMKFGHSKKLLQDPEKLKAVTRWIIDVCDLSTPVMDAKIIMGNSFFAPSNLSGVDMDIPFPRSVLASVSKTHVLFWGNDLTVSEMSREYRTLFFDEGPNGDEGTALFGVKLERRWHLVSKVPVEGSAGIRFQDQRKLVPKGRSAASARQIVWMSILLARQNRHSLFELCEGGKFINCHEAYNENEERISRTSIQFIGVPPVINFEATSPDIIEQSIGFFDSVRPYV